MSAAAVTAPAAATAALEVADLTVDYGSRDASWFGVPSRRPKRMRAVDGVSLSVARSECLAIVGESGSGKTSIGRAVTMQVPYGGTVRVGGVDLATLGRRARRHARRRVQMVFQNPYASLNPMMTIGRQLADSLPPDAGDRAERLVSALNSVGLDESALRRYGHEFSGGQRQRLSIARALVADPEVIVLDEPFSALDVSIQAQILDLLRALKRQTSVAFVLISHDLAAVRHLADRLAVIYSGRLVEEAPMGELYAEPAHPYTKALLTSALEPLPSAAERPIVTIPGEVPEPGEPHRGCPFAGRCPWQEPICAEAAPPHVALGPRRWSACHFGADLADVAWPAETDTQP